MTDLDSHEDGCQTVSLPLVCFRCQKAFKWFVLWWCIGGCNRPLCPGCATPEEAKAGQCAECLAHPERSPFYQMGKAMAEKLESQILELLK